jgi:hypothetical protein
MAIKELNGFAVRRDTICIHLFFFVSFMLTQYCFDIQIGNKRLKVQHKQIRSRDAEPQHGHSPSGYHGEEYAAEENSHAGWYGEPPKAAPQAAPQAEESYEGKEDEGVDLHRSGLGNLDPLRNALPDITGQSEG